PAREFPADGAAGEGFTNAGEALSMSPALLNKFLLAAKSTADHAVLLPDGFRFSPSTTRRDWTDEASAAIRSAYKQFNPGQEDGKLDFTPYLAATVKYRDDLSAVRMTPATVAGKEKLNAKYLAILWQSLTDAKPGAPLDQIQACWR